MLRTPFANLLALGLALAISGCALFSGEPRFVAVQDTPIASGAYSQGTVFDGLLFTAGVFPGDPKTGLIVQGDITAQTHRVLDSVEAILKKVGCTMKDVVRVNVYLADFADLAKMDEVIAARFGANRPARATLPASKLPGAALLEVDFVARLP